MTMDEIRRISVANLVVVRQTDLDISQFIERFPHLFYQILAQSRTYEH